MKPLKLFTLLILISSIFSVSAQYIQGSNFEYYCVVGHIDEYLYIPEIGPHTTIEFTYIPYDGNIPFNEYIIHYNSVKGKVIIPYYHNEDDKLEVEVNAQNHLITVTNPTDETIRDVSIVVPYGYVIDFSKDYQIPTYQAQQTLHTETYNQIFTDYPQIIPILLVAMQMAVWLGGGSYIRSVVVLILGAGVVSILLPGILVVVFTKTPEIVAIIIAVQFIGLYQEFIKR